MSKEAHILVPRNVNRTKCSRLISQILESTSSDVIYVDFSDVMWVSSAAIGLLLAKKSSLPLGRIQFVNVAPELYDLFNFVGISLFFKINRKPFRAGRGHFE